MSVARPSPIRAALFDFDDTLVDTTEALIQLDKYWYRTLPRDNRPETEEEFIARMFEPHPLLLGLRDACIRMLDIWPGCFPDVDSALRAHNEAEAKMVSLDPRTEAMLLDLKSARVPLGVVTNGPTELQWAKARNTGVADLVDAVVVSEEFGVNKPHPSIFTHALDLIGASASETLFVGDNPEADIVGASEVGMQTAWMSHGRSWQIASPRPTYVIDHVWDVRPLLGV